MFLIEHWTLDSVVLIPLLSKCTYSYEHLGFLRTPCPYQIPQCQLFLFGKKEGISSQLTALCIVQLYASSSNHLGVYLGYIWGVLAWTSSFDVLHVVNADLKSFFKFFY